ncbi:unnamed protein product [Lampetra planeri]
MARQTWHGRHGTSRFGGRAPWRERVSRGSVAVAVLARVLRRRRRRQRSPLARGPRQMTALRQTTDVRNGNKRRQSAGESLRRFPSGLSMGGRQSTAHPIGRATSVLQNLGEIEKPGRLANPRLVFRADGQHGTPGPAASEREPPGV